MIYLFFNCIFLATSLKKHIRVRLFWLKRVLGNHFIPLYVFGKHWKLGQTEINFRVNRKYPTWPVKPFLVLFYLQSIYTPHTLSWSFSHAFLIDILQAQLWPSSTEQDSTRRKVTLSFMPIWAPPTVRRSNFWVSSSPMTHSPPSHPRWVSFIVWTNQPLTLTISIRSTLYFTLIQPPIHPPF